MFWNDEPQRIVANVITMALVVAGLGWTSWLLFLNIFLHVCNVPDNLCAGHQDLGPLTRNLLIPCDGYCWRCAYSVLMGRIADVSTMALGFLVPLVCFAFIVYYGLIGYRPGTV
jgi:FHS family L-fucose permease-like MFS transporter